MLVNSFFVVVEVTLETLLRLTRVLFCRFLFPAEQLNFVRLALEFIECVVTTVHQRAQFFG